MGVEKYKIKKISSLKVDRTKSVGLKLGLKRINRIFEYSFEMIERIFVRFQTNIRMETNICLLLMCNYMIFVYIGGIENIYSYLNCLLLSNFCLIHFVAIIILL